MAATPAVLPSIAATDLNALATQIGIVSVSDLTREERISLLQSLLLAQGIAAMSSFSTSIASLATAAGALAAATAAETASSEKQTADMVAASDRQAAAMATGATALTAMAPKV